MILKIEREDLVLFSAIIFIFGAVIGSFLNVVINRVPRGESIITPRSHCTKCGKTIAWYYNIPIISYLILGGKCKYCNEKYSINYFLVEVLSAIIALTLFIKIGFSLEYFLILAMFYTLLVLSFIDLEYKAVPDWILLLVVILGFSCVYNNFLDSIKDGFIFVGAFVMLDFFVTFYIQNIKSKILKDETLKTQRALGEGDLPIIAVIGALLGLASGMIAIFLAALFAIIPSIYNNIKNSEKQTAFIPYLSLGFFVEYIFQISKVIL
ncbi:prepilin peptidase [Arcobacter sp.]|uniref:prepilin peptidase n=1 Tax=unclassified Arcobacter TaxID=2593671 RepID=UPI003B00649B